MFGASVRCSARLTPPRKYIEIPLKQALLDTGYCMQYHSKFDLYRTMCGCTVYSILCK